MRPPAVEAVEARKVVPRAIKHLQRKRRADRDNRRQSKLISKDCRSELFLCRECLNANIHLCNRALTEWFSILRLCGRKAPALVAVSAVAEATN
jgi:hypothetical protein